MNGSTSHAEGKQFRKAAMVRRKCLARHIRPASTETLDMSGAGNAHSRLFGREKRSLLLRKCAVGQKEQFWNIWNPSAHSANFRHKTSRISRADPSRQSPKSTVHFANSTPINSRLSSKNWAAHIHTTNCE